MELSIHARPLSLLLAVLAGAAQESGSVFGTVL